MFNCCTGNDEVAPYSIIIYDNSSPFFWYSITTPACETVTTLVIQIMFNIVLHLCICISPWSFPFFVPGQARFHIPDLKIHRFASKTDFSGQHFCLVEYRIQRIRAIKWTEKKGWARPATWKYCWGGVSNYWFTEERDGITSSKVVIE